MKARLPKGMGGGAQNMNAMIRQAQQMQEDMTNLQEQLDAKEYEVTAGGGVVTIKINGNKDIMSLDIKPEIVDPDDIETLTDVLLAGINEAIKNMPPVTLTLVDGSTYENTGHVESVSGVVNTNTGSVQLRAVFDNENGILHSGSTGNVIIPTTYNQALVVPATAAVQTQDRFRVFLVGKDSIAHGKAVTVNEQKAGDLFIVTSGLEGGEEIVAEGAGMVKEGQKVK